MTRASNKQIIIEVDNEVYGPSWDGNLGAATKNALFDIIETLGSGQVSSIIQGAGISIDQSTGDVTISIDSSVMTKGTYDPNSVEGDSFDMDNMVQGTVNLILTQGERDIIANQSGTNTGDQDLSGLAEKVNVLELDNTTPFNPNADYEPSTKKYVDDSISSGGFGDMSKTVYDPNNIEGNAFDMDEMVEGGDTKILTEAERIVISNQSGINTGDQDLSGLAEKVNVLELDNTTPFVPNQDYEPATKKYVDDIDKGVTSIIPGLGISIDQSSGDVTITNDLEIKDTIYGASWNGDTEGGASRNAIYDAIEGVKSTITNIDDTPYDISWNGSQEGATKNALYDEIEAIRGTIPSVVNEAYGAGWDGSLNGASQNSIYDEIESVKSSIPNVDNTAYGVGWDGDLDGASKNAIYDKIEALEVAEVKNNAYGISWSGSLDGASQDSLYDKIESILASGVTSIIEGPGISIDQATGDVTITNDLKISDLSYSALWDGNLEGASKNAIYDKIESIVNSGVQSIVAGDGISIDQATGIVTITATVVISDEVYGPGWSGNITDGANKNELYDAIEDVRSEIPNIENDVYGISWISNMSGATKETLYNEIESVKSSIVPVSDLAYSALWDGNFEAATKNSLYDKMETFLTSQGLQEVLADGNSATSLDGFSAVTMDMDNSSSFAFRRFDDLNDIDYGTRLNPNLSEIFHRSAFSRAGFIAENGEASLWTLNTMDSVSKTKFTVASAPVDGWEFELVTPRPTLTLDTQRTMLISVNGSYADADGNVVIGGGGGGDMFKSVYDPTNIGTSVYNVLQLNNLTEYTPTTDWHPATKKYVDDNSGGGGTLQSVTDAGATTTNEIEVGGLIVNTGSIFMQESGQEGVYIEYQSAAYEAVVQIPAFNGGFNVIGDSYNATTNVPTTSNADTDKKGAERIVSVGGTQDFGAGSITFAVGDIIANDGAIWYKKVDNNQSGGGDYSEWAGYSGTRAGGDLILQLGDYDTTLNGFRIDLNMANKTLGLGDIDEEENGTFLSVNDTTAIITAYSALGFSIVDPSIGVSANLQTSNLTVDRLYQFPDKAGTIALLSDTDTSNEWADYSGTRAGNDLILRLGDYDDSGTGTAIEISNSDGEIRFMPDNNSTVAQFNSYSFDLYTRIELLGDRVINFNDGFPNYDTAFSAIPATAPRTINLPDASGTLALLSDVTASGLEALDEGNGIGYRLVGKNPAQSGNIGEGAIDFGVYFAVAGQGATGYASFNTGEDNISGGYASFTSGYNNVASASMGAAFGESHNNNQYASFLTGYGNVAINPSRGYNLISGRGNTATDGFGNMLLGTSLIQTDGVGVSVLGHANEAITSTSTGMNVLDPVLIVGNGTHAVLPTGDWSIATTRSNAFVVLQSGAVNAPSLTPTIIDAQGDASLITKEYGDANYLGGGGSSTGLETVDQGNGDGLVIIGRTGANYGNVGTRAVDLSFSDEATATNGATGVYSFAAGWNAEASGNYSFAFGYTATASGGSSIAIGGQAIAQGTIAIGSSVTKADLQRAIAIGEGAEAQGGYSVAIGANNNAYSYSETSMGRFGTSYTPASTTVWTLTDRLFSLGNGVNSGARSDAFVALKDGSLFAPTMTTAMITAASNDVLITKEYGDANYAVVGTTAPASATATGTAGEIRVTSTFIYTCVSTDVWVRAAVATW